MRYKAATVEDIVDRCLLAVKSGDPGRLHDFDRLPSPVYVTDAQGVITYYNQACVEFAGRRPDLGKDSWCVTWKLYTRDGDFLPHDRCPMADAIRHKRAVRGVEATAERPDGKRVDFVPYAMPVLDDDGTLLGAVNLLTDITDRKRAAFLRAQARRCRRLANATSDEGTVETLGAMALRYEEQAAVLGRLN